MRLVASDLDGTIVRPDGSISDRTLAALASCEEQGVGVLFVTGRPPRWMQPVAEATGHRGVAVCGNGAVVYDLGTERIVSTRGLTEDIVLKVGAALRAVLPDAVLALETTSGFRREPAFLPHHEVARLALAGSLPELLADHPLVVKVLCRVEGATADPILAAAREALAGLAEPVHSNSGGSMIEISALGVSKASTLALIAEERDIDPRDVVAFGDMPNDLAMLSWAGRGYVVANGHSTLLSAGFTLVPANGEDGVGQTVLQLLG